MDVAAQSEKHRSNTPVPEKTPIAVQESSSVTPEQTPATTRPAETTDNAHATPAPPPWLLQQTRTPTPRPHHRLLLLHQTRTGVFNHLVSPLSLAMVLWFTAGAAFVRREETRLADEGHPREHASIERAAYNAAALIPFCVTGGWFQANMLAAPGNSGRLLGVLGPVLIFAATVATQTRDAFFLGAGVALVTFCGHILSRHSQSRDPMSFALIAFSLVAQFGLAIATSFLHDLKDAVPVVVLAGLVAPATTLLHEAVGHLFLVMSWQRWGAKRKMAIAVILTALIAECGKIVRLVGVLSAVNAEDPLQRIFLTTSESRWSFHFYGGFGSETAVA
jgi:hypothetical protein